MVIANSQVCTLELGLRQPEILLSSTKWMIGSYPLSLCVITVFPIAYSPGSLKMLCVVEHFLGAVVDQISCFDRI